MGYPDAVMNGNPVFGVVLFLPFFLAHNLNDFSRCILGEASRLAAFG